MKSNSKILIIGSTGKLGSKLLNFSYFNKIRIDAITCYKNINLLKFQSKKFKIKNSFCLANESQYESFNKYLSNNKINIVYFLDHGSSSLKILNEILKHQTNTNIAVANKEMIIAGNKYMIDKIIKSKNFFTPLDSEHFSLINSNISNNNVNKIYITASGGPFYLDKKINLNKVTQSQVLNHPKWIMGNNNLIDSSNFVNKILEIYELSIIFKIDINKIDFLISPEAYIHSIILFNNYITSLNCFNNDMLIPLTYPLAGIYKFKLSANESKFLIKNNYFFEKYNDKRFKLFRYLKKLKNLNHAGQIKFMILNNIAQNLYLNNKLKYDQIISYIIKRIDNYNDDVKLNSFNDIQNYIIFIKKIFGSNEIK